MAPISVIEAVEEQARNWRAQLREAKERESATRHTWQYQVERVNQAEEKVNELEAWLNAQIPDPNTSAGPAELPESPAFVTDATCRKEL